METEINAKECSQYGKDIQYRRGDMNDMPRITCAVSASAEIFCSKAETASSWLIEKVNEKAKNKITAMSVI